MAIGKIKKGALHKELGIKQGKHIPMKLLDSKLAQAKRTHNVKLERRILFAKNFSKGK